MDAGLAGLPDHPSGFMRAAMQHREVGAWLIASADGLARGSVIRSSAQMESALWLGAAGATLLVAMSGWTWRRPAAAGATRVLGLGLAWFALGTAVLVGSSRLDDSGNGPARFSPSAICPGPACSGSVRCWCWRPAFRAAWRPPRRRRVPSRSWRWRCAVAQPPDLGRAGRRSSTATAGSLPSHWPRIRTCRPSTPPSRSRRRPTPCAPSRLPRRAGSDLYDRRLSAASRAGTARCRPCGSRATDPAKTGCPPQSCVRFEGSWSGPASGARLWVRDATGTCVGRGEITHYEDLGNTPGSAVAAASTCWCGPPGPSCLCGLNWSRRTGLSSLRARSTDCREAGRAAGWRRIARPFGAPPLRAARICCYIRSQ